MRRHQGHSFNGAEGSCGVRGTGDHWKHVTTWVFKPFELSQHLHRGSCYIALMTCFPWMNLLSLSTNLVLGVHRISIRDVTLARFGDRFRSWQAFKAKPCYRVPWRSAIRLSLLAAHFCPQFLLTYESRTEAFLLHGGGWCGSLGLVLTLRRLNTLPLEPSWLPVTEFLGFAPDLQKPKSFHHFQPIDRRRPWNTASFDHSHGKKSTKGPMKRRRLPSREREAEMFQRERARSVQPWGFHRSLAQWEGAKDRAKAASVCQAATSWCHRSTKWGSCSAPSISGIQLQWRELARRDETSDIEENGNASCRMEGI